MFTPAPSLSHAFTHKCKPKCLPSSPAADGAWEAGTGGALEARRGNGSIGSWASFVVGAARVGFGTGEEAAEGAVGDRGGCMEGVRRNIRK